MAGSHRDPGAGMRVEVRDQAVGHRAVEELGEEVGERSLQSAQVGPEPGNGGREEMPPESRSAAAGAATRGRHALRLRARRPGGGGTRSGRGARPSAGAGPESRPSPKVSRVEGRAAGGEGRAAGTGSAGSGEADVLRPDGAESRSFAGSLTNAVAVATLRSSADWESSARRKRRAAIVSSRWSWRARTRANARLQARSADQSTPTRDSRSMSRARSGVGGAAMSSGDAAKVAGADECGNGPARGARSRASSC